MHQRRISVSRAIMAIFAVLILAIATISNVSAQSITGPGNGFRVSPVRYELIVQKGTSQTVTMQIENPTNATIAADVLINDFEANSNESGEPKVMFDPKVSASSSSFKAIASAQKNIELGPGQKKDLKVTIGVPNNAEAGGYYGVVRTVPSTEIDKNISLSASVGTLFLVRVPGNITESLVLKDFTAAKNGSTGRLFINSGAMTIVTRLENTGNIHVKPFGKVQVLDRSGKVVQEYEFNNTDPKGNVLPKSTRKFVDNLKDQKWLGRYTVKANFGYGTGGNLITAKSTFWVVPIWFIITVVAIILLILAAAYFVYRKFTGKRKHIVKPRR